MTRRPSADPATLAGLLVVWAVAWSVAPGRIAEDTKNDLYVNAWGFLKRALHLWDPQVTWGGLSNQGYGYLFPMGPFFALGSEVAPVWVVQRLWWSVLLTAGLLGTAGLLRALAVGTPRTRIVGALAYVLAPRVISSIGALGAEIQPQLLAPLIVWPLVLASRGRISTARAVSLSGVAALCCGGVNATATLSAFVPAGLWLLTRRRWWRAPLTWSWAAAMVAATAWWLGPLIVMSRYAPPFLDWIENARAVMQPIGMLDVARGTTHWLGHIVTPGGPWWPSGYELATRPSLIVVTTLVAAVGLGGLALAAVPERRWLWTSLLIGGVALTIGHSGPLSSPFVDVAQSALDGPLAPLRNIHKLDLLVRLPLVVGLTHVLGRLTSWQPRVGWRRPLAIGAVTLAVVGAAAPGFTGAIAVRGTFDRMPQHWVDAGRWLDAHKEQGQALVLPAANFGEYYWGRTIDEPLRPLTKAAYAVRDAVPIAPAGTIRLLDEIERRLQSGRSIEGGAQVLSQAGMGHLVVRNDLATGESGQPPVALARSSVRATAGVTFAKGFGQTFIDASGQRVFPVEIYDLPDRASAPLQMWDSSEALAASGASEDLVSLADEGLLSGPVVFDGDRVDALNPTSRVETDGYRARQRWFGAPRGQDLTSTLTAASAAKVPDYLPWSNRALRSAVTYGGISDVRATSSLAEDLGFAGLRPAHRPFAALDGDPTTSWAAMWDEHPTLTVELPAATTFDHVVLTGLVRDATLGSSVSRPTRVRVSTDEGAVTADIGSGPTRVDVPGVAHSRVSVEVLATQQERPGLVVTGISELSIPGVTATESIQLPRAEVEGDDPDAIVLGAGLRGRDGCAISDRQFVCLSGQGIEPEQSGNLVRGLGGELAGPWTASGQLAPGVGPAGISLLQSPEASVTASSVRTDAPQAAPSAIIDGDDRTAWSPALADETPELTVEFGREVTVSTIRLQTRRDWATEAAPAVVVDVGGREFTRRIQRGGELDIPATTGTQLRLEFVSVPGHNAAAAPIAALELEELSIGGLDIAPPPAKIVATCGHGPKLVVDDHEVATSASVSRNQLFGVGAGTWSACGPVTFSPGASHTVTVGTWQGLTARAAVLKRAVTAPTAPSPRPQAVAAAQDGATWRGEVAGSGQQRLLVMDQNTNQGWVARVGATVLRTQVVDGRRQGFLVPPDTSGRLEITFGPDASYRAALVMGLALALALLTTCLLSLRRDAPRVESPCALTVPIRMRRISPDVAQALIAGALGAVVAGPAGAGAALLGSVAGLSLDRRFCSHGRAAVVAAGVVACGIAQAALAPGSLGGPVLEGGIRVVLLAMVALAAAMASGKESRREA